MVAQKKVPTDSLFHVASSVVHVIKAFDRNKSGKTVQSFTVPYDADYRKKTRLTVTFSNGTIRKFTYMAYSDGLADVAEDTYYFDSTGQLTCHPNLATGVLSYDVFVDPYLVLFTQEGDTTNSVLHGDIGKFQLTASKYIVDYYLSAAGLTSYTTFTVSPRARFPLEALKQLPLQQSPSVGSPVLQTLPKGAIIYYLDRSGNRDSLSKAGPWIWYKVQTSAGRIGWIWGYPSGVHEHTDE
jgi:hypothetical protein